MSCESAEPTRVCSCAHTRTGRAAAEHSAVASTVGTAFVQYLQVVDEQLVEGRVGVQINQEALVVYHSDSGRLEGNSETFQLPLTFLKKKKKHNQDLLAC